MITRHTSKMFVMEGQEVSLRCKSVGDPEPSTHWVSPDGKLIGNTSRTVCYENGSLDILKASVKVQTCCSLLLFSFLIGLPVRSLPAEPNLSSAQDGDVAPPLVESINECVYHNWFQRDLSEKTE